MTLTEAEEDAVAECCGCDTAIRAAGEIVDARVAAALEGAAQVLDALADENRDGIVDSDAAVYDAAAREVRRFASVVAQVLP